MFSDELIARLQAINPDIAEFASRIMAAAEEFDLELDSLRDLEPTDRAVGVTNAMMQYLLALGGAMDGAKLKPGRKELRAKLIRRRPTREAWKSNLGHKRALIVAVAYEMGVRLEASGPKDTPMEAANYAAAVLEKLSGPEHELERLLGADTDAASETVRKSIQRFRRKVKGTKLIRLNIDRMAYEQFDAESALLAGLPGKSGRPKKG